LVKRGRRQEGSKKRREAGDRKVDRELFLEKELAGLQKGEKTGFCAKVGEKEGANGAPKHDNPTRRGLHGLGKEE